MSLKVEDVIRRFETGMRFRLAIYSAITWLGLIAIWVVLLTRH